MYKIQFLAHTSPLKVGGGLKRVKGGGGDIRKLRRREGERK
jgi:hypothetical protein